ncbi:hypothetical protein BS78_02G393000 [Paspalum vaginatum]|nr:hypothetical protein BS78_02G393000 [Paspalum vaginatum]
MDAYEATKLVFSRIQALDPDHAAKIMGFLLIQDHGDKEMIRLAFGPEALLHAVMAKARNDLGLRPPSGPATPTSAATSPFLLSRQNSGRCCGNGAGTAPSPLSSLSSPSSWAPPPVFSRTNNGHANEEMPGAGDELLVSPANGGDALQLQALFDGAGHRRSSSVSELCLGGGADGLGWKPCLYYARGYCKNGSACRFVHGGLPDDAAAAKSQRLAAAFPYSPTGTGSLPGSPSAATKCLSLLLQQQNESQRAAAAAAAAALILGGDDAHKFMARPRLDRADLASVINPGSRQIYLTFPADSTFREEDVSNYFSIYGPVHDVRIPYQQKRMFGFVTFVYPETVKLILAKGNPHFICDARVLVKPYKEKGKVPDKYRKLQGERVDFSNGADARDPFDLHQLGATRMLQHSHSANEMLLRRKLEEQQQAAELQQAMELQSRRLMELQLLDLNKSRSSPTSHIGMPFSPTRAVASPTVGSPPDSGTTTTTPFHFLLPQRRAVNGGDKEESAGEASPDGDSDQSAEHNLPDSPFASPTEPAAAAFSHDPFAPAESEIAAASPVRKATTASFAGINNGGGLTSHLRPSALDIPSPKAYFFPMSRLSTDHGAGAIGM